MKTELLDKIYKETLNKPQLYNHLCYGGSSIKMIDTHTPNKNFTCQYQGDENWATPACKKCKGLISKSKSLTEYQKNLNYGIESLYNAISHVLTDGNTAVKHSFNYTN